ncbi:MAG: hypothetical protein Unbinned2716contig1000_24 [Prokaryotic dsDNA virus sp.]|nr:MAG: hypothetical protein Unbinned2716contig1000_24 [Prokaryotic dsDNA virus sp.]|tara:strand:+ start:16688 stop:17605 length:918 start_codon:yes stop_codon:yes gene_type:complete
MKLFLAGVNDQNKLQAVYRANHPYILSSYWEHQRGFHKEWLHWYKKTRDKGADFIMDSGLFTMMFGAGSDKTYSEKELLDYTNKYLKDIKAIGYNNYIVEMDVHKVLGLQSLKRFRKIFEKEYPLEKTIFVWHVEEKELGFKKLCEKYPYIAISIPELRIIFKGNRKSLRNAIKNLIKIANDINPNIKIHLLGCTQISLMEQKGYYSCDSTSWQSSQMFGTCYYFDNKLKRVKETTDFWKQYALRMEDKIWRYSDKTKEEKFKKLTAQNYWRNASLCAMAFSKLNQHINNRYYNFEQIKKLNYES